jgi:formamidopyrimidine-DNA glycosylase
MPELPEVETVRRTLLEHVTGLVVARVQIHRSDIIGACTPEAPQLCGRHAFLNRTRIVGSRRHGKQLALASDRGLFMRVQLGMTGHLLVRPARLVDGEPDHVHITWHLRPPDARRIVARLCYRDVRRFGVVWPACSEDELADAWSSLGPDALTISTASLRRALAKTNRPLKAALLDQDRLAGIGNIYADESLSRARLHPLTPANSLTAGEQARLARSIRSILGGAVKVGGSTIRDHLDANGEIGYFQTQHRVYGRAGQPCRSCGSTLVGLRIIGRATVFCPVCQPVPRGMTLASLEEKI